MFLLEYVNNYRLTSLGWILQPTKSKLSKWQFWSKTASTRGPTIKNLRLWSSLLWCFSDRLCWKCSSKVNCQITPIICFNSLETFNNICRFRLRNLDLEVTVSKVDVLPQHPEEPSWKIIDRITERGVLYAITVDSKNAEFRSLTLNLLQGSATVSITNLCLFLTEQKVSILSFTDVSKHAFRRCCSGHRKRFHVQSLIWTKSWWTSMTDFSELSSVKNDCC